MFSKIEVNGDGACDLYKLLKEAQPGPEGKGDIAWNWGVTDIRIDPLPAEFTPTDTNYGDQWHLRAIGNLERIWAEYTGQGVAVGIYDDGLQHSHHDLDDNDHDSYNHHTARHNHHVHHDRRPGRRVPRRSPPGIRRRSRRFAGSA